MVTCFNGVVTRSFWETCLMFVCSNSVILRSKWFSGTERLVIQISGTRDHDVMQFNTLVMWLLDTPVAWQHCQWWIYNSQIMARSAPLIFKMQPLKWKGVHLQLESEHPTGRSRYITAAVWRRELQYVSRLMILYYLKTLLSLCSMSNACRLRPVAAYLPVHCVTIFYPM